MPRSRTTCWTELHRAFLYPHRRIPWAERLCLRHALRMLDPVLRTCMLVRSAGRWCLAVWLVTCTSALAQTPNQPAPQTDPSSATDTPSQDRVFDMGKIVVIGTPDGQPAVGGSILTSEQIWMFDRKSLDQAVNVIPGVVSTSDSLRRRNESDIFVRGFVRWQVPLMVDGVRIYLPADNRLDYARFLTADIA